MRNKTPRVYLAIGGIFGGYHVPLVKYRADNFDSHFLILSFYGDTWFLFLLTTVKQDHQHRQNEEYCTHNQSL